jgi:hypothetical protein
MASAAISQGSPPPPIMERPSRGSRISSFYPVKTLPPLSALDSAFQLQEYISLLIRLDVHDVDRIVDIPGGGGTNGEGGEGKDGHNNTEAAGEGSKVEVDKACWISEQLRYVRTFHFQLVLKISLCFINHSIHLGKLLYSVLVLSRLAQDLNHPLITMLQQECNRNTCPEMKAGEWLYLCVAHGNDGAMEVRISCAFSRNGQYIGLLSFLLNEYSLFFLTPALFWFLL